MKSLLRAMAWLFFTIAGLSFWVGGRVIKEFAKTEQVLAEMEGIALAVLFGGLGAAAKAAEHRFAESEKDESSMSEGESLRK